MLARYKKCSLSLLSACVLSSMVQASQAASTESSDENSNGLYRLFWEKDKNAPLVNELQL